MRQIFLNYLDGHPAIPKLYGYGHFEHFEYLAIELLGKMKINLRRVFSIQEVADIGVQLVLCFFLVIISFSHRGLL